MSAADVRAFVDRAAQAWNAHDREGYLGTHTDDVEITAPGGMRMEGRQGAEMFYDAWQGGFPDTRVDIKSVIADESSACIEAVFTGTQKGALQTPMGEIPATGKHVAIPFTHLWTLSGDKASSTRLYFDTAELLTQLGVAPAPAGASV